ncbi:hypothetical protein QYF61_015929 [Mycteria americana]|uniref:Uncharacterized protein n=1 Tax=Mycteria americana TaxID=33587 RepID=A0AAN7S8L4_MYCAM|nr:hypothetical protein QYF61_015929 [Mycteria americana]
MAAQTVCQTTAGVEATKMWLTHHNCSHVFCCRCQRHEGLERVPWQSHHKLSGYVSRARAQCHSQAGVLLQRENAQGRNERIWAAAQLFCFRESPRLPQVERPRAGLGHPLQDSPNGQSKEQHHLHHVCSTMAQENIFHHEGGQALAQVAQRGCGISILGDIQSPAGHGPEQPAVADPALDRGLDQMTSRVQKIKDTHL